MFCIAAFIILAIISIFSASHRKLAKKAWSCTLRRVTLRPCDSSFKEETKNQILSHVASRKPGLVKAADISIEVASFIFVTLTIWSLFYVLVAGLNLFVWGTCTPNNASSCSLGAETCSISKVEKGFWELTLEGKPIDWFVNEAKSLGETIANIPTRLQKWEAKDYLPSEATYYLAFDKTKPTALEVIDPGCIVCLKLFNNIKQAGFEKKYNLTYIAYPIANPNEAGKYKFKNSYLVATYLEAVRLNPLSGQKTPADWQILERIYTGKDDDGASYQININSILNSAQTEKLLTSWLSDISYDQTQIDKIKLDSKSQAVADRIKRNKSIVETKIRTVKIPTIIFNGQRHDGLVSVNDLD